MPELWDLYDEVVDAKFITYEKLNIMWKNGVIIPKKRFIEYKNQIEKYANNRM